MSPEHQSLAALAVVVVTLGVFVLKAFRRQKTGCGGACGCPQKLKRGAVAKSSGSL